MGRRNKNGCDYNELEEGLKMGNITFRIIVRRFLELFFVNAAISAILTILNIGKVLARKDTLLLGMFVGIAVFVIMNFRMLRRCYFDLKNRFLYYTANIAAYFLFALLSAFVYLVFSSKIYTWLFAVTKFLKYTKIALSVPYSAAIFHLIGFSVIFIAPIGMGWIFSYDDDE